MTTTRTIPVAHLVISLIVLVLTPVANVQACENSSVSVEGAVVRVFTSRSLVQDADCRWTAWIERSLGSVADISGRFPVDRVTIFLDRSRGSQPVAYGWVRRNNPPEVHLRVFPAATLDDLLDDWRGYHEFAHLLLPFVGNRDIWFAEGLASYYQHFLQARAGVIDSEQSWQRLVAGFQRGLDDPAGRGESLDSLSPKMWSERAFRRVYWTGAAFFLRVDYRLRLASDGEHTLDTTLAAFQDCCMSGDGSRANRYKSRWDAEAMVAELGKLSLSEIWQEEYQRTIEQLAEPDFGEAGEYLGLRIQSGQIVMDTDRRYRDRRKSLALGEGFDPVPAESGQAALIDELEEVSGFLVDRGPAP